MSGVSAVNGSQASIYINRGIAYDHDSSWLERAVVYNLAGRYAEALKGADQAVAINPKRQVEHARGTALYGRGVARRMKGDATGGDADMAAATRMDASVAALMATSGMAVTTLAAAPRPAVSKVDIALGSPKAYYDRGYAYIDTKQYDKAFEDFSKASCRPMWPSQWRKAE